MSIFNTSMSNTKISLLSTLQIKKSYDEKKQHIVDNLSTLAHNQSIFYRNFRNHIPHSLQNAVVELLRSKQEDITEYKCGEVLVELCNEALEITGNTGDRDINNAKSIAQLVANGKTGYFNIPQAGKFISSWFTNYAAHTTQMETHSEPVGIHSEPVGIHSLSTESDIQKTDNDTPIGMAQITGNDCFINSGLQLILNSEALIKAMEDHENGEIKTKFISLSNAIKNKNLSPDHIETLHTDLIMEIRHTFKYDENTQESVPNFIAKLFGKNNYFFITNCENTDEQPITDQTNTIFSAFTSDNYDFNTAKEYLGKIYRSSDVIKDETQKKKSRIESAYEELKKTLNQLGISTEISQLLQLVKAESFLETLNQNHYTHIKNLLQQQVDCTDTENIFLNTFLYLDYDSMTDIGTDTIIGQYEGYDRYNKDLQSGSDDTELKQQNETTNKICKEYDKLKKILKDFTENKMGDRIISDADMARIMDLENLDYETFISKLDESMYNVLRLIINPSKDKIEYLFDVSGYNQNTTEYDTLELVGKKFNFENIATNRIQTIVVHIGESASNGHYKSYVKKQDIWYECNDDNIIQIQAGEDGLPNIPDNESICCFTCDHNN